MRCILTFTAKASLHAEHRLIRMAATGPEIPKAADGATPLSGRIQDYLKDLKDDQNNSGLMEKMILEKLKTEGVVSSDKEIQELMQVAESAFLRLESLQHLNVAQHRAFVAGLMAQFPRDNDALLRMATANGFLDPAAMARAINDSKNFNSSEDPSEQSGEKNEVPLLDRLMSERRSIQGELLMVAKNKVKGPDGVYVQVSRQEAIARQAELIEQLRAVQKGLAGIFGTNSWRQGIRAYESQKAGERGYGPNEGRGVSRQAPVEEPWDAEIQRGIQNNWRTRETAHSKYSRAAAKMKQGDFVDNGQIPMYEYRVPSTFKPSPRRGADGQMQEVDRDEWMSYQPGSDGRSSAGSSGSNRPRGKVYKSQKAQFGPGRISEKGHDDAVKRSTSHLDPDVQDELRLRGAEDMPGKAREAIAQLEKEYPYEVRSKALSFKQLEFLLSKSTPADMRDWKTHYQKIIDTTETIRDQISRTQSIDKLGEGVSAQATYIPVAPGLLNSVYITNEETGEEYQLQPQMLFSERKDVLMSTLEDLRAQGIAVRFERNGKTVENSNQKYVSGVYLDFLNPADRQNKRFSIRTKGKKQEYITKELGSAVLGKKAEIAPVVPADALDAARLPFGQEYPLQMSVARTEKNGKSRLFTRQELQRGVRDDEIGVVIQSLNGKPVIYFTKPGGYILQKQMFTGGNFDRVFDVEVASKKVTDTPSVETLDIKKSMTSEQFTSFKKSAIEMKDEYVAHMRTTKAPGWTEDDTQKFEKEFTDRLREYDQANTIVQEGPAKGWNINAWNIHVLMQTCLNYGKYFEQKVPATPLESERAKTLKKALKALGNTPNNDK